MKSKLIFSTCLLFFFLSLKGQWTGTNPVYTNSNVGIGTSSPNFNMQLHGGSSYFQWTKTETGANSTDGTLLGLDGGSGDLNFYIRQRENSGIKFYTNDLSRMTISSEGNIGIGTDPSWRLSVADDKSEDAVAYIINTSSNGYGTKLRGGSGTRYALRIVDYNDNHIMSVLGNGNIGLGTTNPTAKLDIDLAASGTPTGLMFTLRNSLGTNTPTAIFMLEQATQNVLQLRGSSGGGGNREVMTWNLYNGNVGIGTVTPINELSIIDNINIYGGPPNGTMPSKGILIGSASTSGILNMGIDATGQVFYSWIQSRGIASATYYNLALNPYGGNILVGKSTQTNTNYKLDVNGKIRADEVVVNTTGADFVFDKDYRLPGIGEIKKFIIDNRHLPGFSSASDMKENGISVSDMQTKLLQKIEEMTLYLIQQEDKIKILENKIKILESKL